MSQLNDQTEQQMYNAFSASTPDTLTSQLERQVYNAYQAAGGGGGGGGGGGATPELTEEHVVGKLNGKPVYEKLLKGTTGANGKENKIIIDESLKNIEVIFISGITSNDLNQFFPIYFVSSSDYFWVYCSVGSGSIIEKHGHASYSQRPLYVKINYTKTTD